MATHKNLSELFTAIANAIRAVDDTIVGKLKADDFPTIISNIQTGIDTTLPVNEAAAAGDIVSGKKAFVNETLVTGTLAARTSLTFSSVTNATSAVTVKGKHTARFIGNANTDISISVPYTNLASAIGLTAAKVAKGQTIAGVTGTFSTPSAGTAITAAAVRTGYTGFVNGAEIKGSMPNVTHAKPTATVDNTTGIVTASHTQTAGYVAAGTTTGTLSLTTQATKEITPSTSAQTAVAKNVYTLGAVTVKAMPTGALGTPTYSANTSSGEVTITSNISTAGYLATSVTKSTTVKPFTVRTTGTSTIAPGGSKSLPAGYYPNTHTVTASDGYQIDAVGVTVGDTNELYLEFDLESSDPKGYVLFQRNTGTSYYKLDGERAAICIYDYSYDGSDMDVDVTCVRGGDTSSRPDYCRISLYEEAVNVYMSGSTLNFDFLEDGGEYFFGRYTLIYWY